jgi:hypothetical protein
MKIIEDNHNTFEFRCPKCKSLLKIEKDDLKGGDCFPYFCICVACKNKFNVPNSQIPKQIIKGN